MRQLEEVSDIFDLHLPQFDLEGGWRQLSAEEIAENKETFGWALHDALSEELSEAAHYEAGRRVGLSVEELEDGWEVDHHVVTEVFYELQADRAARDLALSNVVVSQDGTSAILISDGVARAWTLDPAPEARTIAPPGSLVLNTYVGFEAPEDAAHLVSVLQAHAQGRADIDPGAEVNRPAHPLRWRPRGFTVFDENGRRLCVGLARGAFAVAPAAAPSEQTQPGWQVAHLPTGLLLGPPLRSQAATMDLASRLMDARSVDWATVRLDTFFEDSELAAVGRSAVDAAVAGALDAHLAAARLELQSESRAPAANPFSTVQFSVSDQEPELPLEGGEDYKITSVCLPELPQFDLDDFRDFVHGDEGEDIDEALQQLVHEEEQDADSYLLVKEEVLRSENLFARFPPPSEEIMDYAATMDVDDHGIPLWDRRQEEIIAEEIGAQATPQEREDWLADNEDDLRDRLLEELLPQAEEAMEDAGLYDKDALDAALNDDSDLFWDIYDRITENAWESVLQRFEGAQILQDREGLGYSVVVEAGGDVVLFGPGRYSHELLTEAHGNEDAVGQMIAASRRHAFLASTYDPLDAGLNPIAPPTQWTFNRWVKYRSPSGRVSTSAAFARNAFAIVRQDRTWSRERIGWQIVHLPSGLSVGPEVMSSAEARAVATALEPVAPWAVMVPEMARDWLSHNGRLVDATVNAALHAAERERMANARADLNRPLSGPAQNFGEAAFGEASFSTGIDVPRFYDRPMPVADLQEHERKALVYAIATYLSQRGELDAVENRAREEVFARHAEDLALLYPLAYDDPAMVPYLEDGEALAHQRLARDFREATDGILVRGSDAFIAGEAEYIAERLDAAARSYAREHAASDGLYNTLEAEDHLWNELSMSIAEASNAHVAERLAAAQIIFDDSGDTGGYALLDTGDPGLGVVLLHGSDNTVLHHGYAAREEAEAAAAYYDLKKELPDAEYDGALNPLGSETWSRRQSIVLPGTRNPAGFVRGEMAVVPAFSGTDEIVARLSNPPGWQVAHLRTGLVLSGPVLAQASDARAFADLVAASLPFEDLSIETMHAWNDRHDANLSLLVRAQERVQAAAGVQEARHEAERRDVVQGAALDVQNAFASASFKAGHEMPDPQVTSVHFSVGRGRGAPLLTDPKEVMTALRAIDPNRGVDEVFRDFLQAGTSALAQATVQTPERAAALERQYMGVVGRYGGPPPPECIQLPRLSGDEVEQVLATARGRAPITWQDAVARRDQALERMRQANDGEARQAAAYDAAAWYQAGIDRQPMTHMSKLLGSVLGAYQQDPDRDVLGPVYMELASDRHAQDMGQFFTPWPVARMMADMTLGDAVRRERAPGDPPLRVAEPTSGSGVMALAAASAVRDAGHDPATTLLVHTADLDRTCAQMTYLQLAAAGVPAVVSQGDGRRLGSEQDMRETWTTPAVATLVEDQQRHKGRQTQQAPLFSVGGRSQAVPVFSLAPQSRRQESAPSLAAGEPVRAEPAKGQYSTGASGAQDDATIATLRDQYLALSAQEEEAWKDLTAARGEVLEALRQRMPAVTAQKWMSKVEGRVDLVADDASRHALDFLSNAVGAERLGPWLAQAQVFGGISDAAHRAAVALSDAGGHGARIDAEAVTALGEVKRGLLETAVRINPTVDLRIARELYGEGPALMASGLQSTDRVPVAGMYMPHYHLAAISLNPRYDGLDTVYHEGFHSVERVLTPDEQATLSQAFPPVGAMTTPERTAIAFADWAVTRDRQGGAAAAARLAQHIEAGQGAGVTRPFQRLAAMGTAFGKSVTPLFEAIYRGDLGQRSLAAMRDAARDNPALRRAKQTEYSTMAQNDNKTSQTSPQPEERKGLNVDVKRGDKAGPIVVAEVEGKGWEAKVHYMREATKGGRFKAVAPISTVLTHQALDLMPPLEGSDKQKAWAGNLRYHAMREFAETLVEQVRDNPQAVREGAVNIEAWNDVLAQAPADAGWWIDRQDMRVGELLSEMSEPVVEAKAAMAAVESIQEWNHEDIHDLRDALKVIHDTDYARMIDMTALPSEDVPEAVADYPVWAVDKQGRALVGAAADAIEPLQDVLEYYAQKAAPDVEKTADGSVTLQSVAETAPVQDAKAPDSAPSKDSSPAKAPDTEAPPRAEAEKSAGGAESGGIVVRLGTNTTSLDALKAAVAERGDAAPPVVLAAAKATAEAYETAQAASGGRPSAKAFELKNGLKAVAGIAKELGVDLSSIPAVAAVTKPAQAKAQGKIKTSGPEL